ncbi:hypothetical protein F975_00855 [Acinetobacter sp. ANC 3789]|uniref:DUF262 domain-containing protein n=1 Tax=Acinetobacter sp. ANC 3789 TaxID=1217714 RepID=UPI0002CF3FA8|nr:DUF262 domain-containing protein [Acinetobacter sp. ANC 3789]ENU80997.1 hypothetical protein F975_00855 [Acinetobacter sp. ANC 3789]
MNQAVNTELLCLKHVVDESYQFVIPSYQRPYVWSSIHIEDLLNDIEQAFKNKEPHYFIGTTLSSKKDHSTYELIDGQQRTTTLMLFALACHDYRDSDLKGHPILKVSTYDKKPRLHFEIRERIESYLGSQTGLDGFGKPSQDQLIEDAYLKHIHAGLEYIKQRLKKISESELDLKEFIDYIFENVRWINNIIPEKTDLNKLFSSMNTSGIQLEPVDILKSKIFKKITKNKKLYEAIWDACQNMNTYFERVLRKKIEASSWNQLKYEHLEQYDAEKIVFDVNAEGPKALSLKGLSIQDIDRKRINLGPETDSDNEKEIKDQIEEDIPEEGKNHCRSFISFELLLIHALRIYKVLNDENDIEDRLIASNLQKIFKTFVNQSSEKEVKFFLDVLWKVRYQFDTWCVKWLENEDGGGEELRLTSINRQKKKEAKKAYFNRTKKEHSALELLQCVRIFTGERSAQYWLTPFLIHLITAESSLGQDKVVEWLEKIDNDLSLTVDDVTQKVASYQLCIEDEIGTKDWQEIQDYLESQKGTSFEHYWFQKLEYVLWKNYGRRTEKKFKNYRITAKNSVEHVHSQNERYGATLQESYLHAFGNLALLSPGQNSEYSNKPVTVKMAEFDRKPSYDSLKLKCLFDTFKNSGSKNLNRQVIQTHQEKMLALLEKHYSSIGGMSRK